jgi:hypothetical protein
MTTPLPSEIQAISDFDGARDAAGPAHRLTEVRRRASAYREKLLTQSDVVFYRSINLITVPFPVKYGLRDAAFSISPLLCIFNRLFVVQYNTSAGLKTLLFSPSDAKADEQTPFFQSLLNTPFRPIIEPLLVPFRRTVQEALALTGIKPEQVDYISYDHLHTQDIRQWLGTNGAAGALPNARLLVMKKEWDSANALLPSQALWYCPNGMAGIDPRKIIQLDGSVSLGDGIALIHTPGHTEGNHSLVAKTPDGLYVTSENGICADSYAPMHSTIPGVKKHAARYGIDLIMNANTLEDSNDQYISMDMERTIAGPCKRNPKFYNMATSSELTSNFLFPFMKPTFSMGELEYGQAQLA